MKKENQSKINKILFYPGLPRGFRASLIGYLHEISQAYPVVLLSEKLDPETEKILSNKKLFPKLEEIILIRYGVEQKKSWLIKNRYYHKLTNSVIQRHQPDIVITASKYAYPLLFYLKRFAKRAKAINVSLREMPQFVETKEIALYFTLLSAYSKTPAFLPNWIRISFTKFRRCLGHFFFYWILPLTVGEKPVTGEPSCVLMNGVFSKSSDYFISSSKQDYDRCVQEGVPSEKIYILANPLERKTRRFFENNYFSNKPHKKNKKNKKITLMWPAEQIGFRREDSLLISKEEMKRDRIKLVTLITEILKGWRIFIKPHPAVQSIKEIKEDFKSVSDYVKVVNPSEPADKYIEMADVVVGIPPSSTTIYTSSLQCPEKIILFLDLQHEIYGNWYKNLDGVDYIDNEKKLIDILKLIKDGKYRKKNKRKYKVKKSRKEFLNTVELLEYLFLKSKPR